MKSIHQVKRDRLAVEMAEILRARGSIVADASKVEDAELWRSAARKAARSLG